MVNLVKSLKSAGVPLDGVGFQCHFIVGEVPTSMSTVMSQITALGLEVAITELDIRMTLPSTQALLNQQQTDYENVIKQCMAVAGCIGVSIWDYTDKVRSYSVYVFAVDLCPTSVLTVLLGSSNVQRPGCSAALGSSESTIYPQTFTSLRSAKLSEPREETCLQRYCRWFLTEITKRSRSRIFRFTVIASLGVVNTIK